MEINNFRLVYNEPRSTRPPALNHWNEIIGYNVFSSEFNPLIYVIHDHENDLYYTLERTVGFNESSLDHDLKRNIEVRIL